jgi:putative ABC transport system permease protein
MRALDRKLLRDLRRQAAPGAAIALVLACGVAILLMSVGLSRALEATRAAYYERNRFAEVFASVRRAPRTLLPEIAALPGVLAVEARIEGAAVLDLPGRAEAGQARVLSLPAGGGEPALNVPLLREGRWPDPEAAAEVAVNEPFARANGFRPGDRFTAILDGRARELTITGTALSPEFIYTVGPGAMMPDNAGYAILWMPERAAAAAFGMEGAFSTVALALWAGAAEGPVIDALDRLLAPYGATGAHGRSEQVSHAFLDAELRQLGTIAAILPPVFLAITVYLVGMVMGRIVELERAEIGLLKALGYGRGAILGQYLALAGGVAAAGVLLGWLLGSLLAPAMARLYAQYFDFPFLIFGLPPGAYALSAALGVAAATLGALRASLRAAALPPAVAMAPPAPPAYRRGLADRVLTALGPSQPTLMILRSLLRWPLRAALSALGMALAVSVLVAAGFFADALEFLVDPSFNLGNRQEAVLIFAAERPDAALTEVARLPGVLQAEGQAFAPVRLTHGPRRKTVTLEARRPGADLARIVTAEGLIVEPPAGGLMVSERLAASLGARPGDLIEVSFLARGGETHALPLAGTVPLYFGLGAWTDLDTLSGLLREAPRITAAGVTLDPDAEAEFYAALKALPGLAGTVLLDRNVAAFRATIGDNVLVVTSIYAFLGIVITAGVAYNGARIQLSERARELASLRILGFSRAEVSYVLVGETMLLALFAQPFGWWIGAGVARLLTDSFASDLYSVPLVLKPATFAEASLSVFSPPSPRR